MLDVADSIGGCRRKINPDAVGTAAPGKRPLGVATQLFRYPRDFKVADRAVELFTEAPRSVDGR